MDDAQGDPEAPTGDTRAPTARAGGLVRAPRRDPAATRAAILGAAREVLLRDGFTGLATRHVAETAGVPLSQIHYHFGSRQGLVLALLEEQDARLLERQRTMYATDLPLWRRWELACDLLDADLDSGYVRLLQELIAAGWSDPVIATHVRAVLSRWFDLLTDVARQAIEASATTDARLPTAAEAGALMGLPFVGAEALLLLGMTPSEVPIRAALRAVGGMLRTWETSDGTETSASTGSTPAPGTG
ncbi:MAG: TetR/AcrR family transcriptional regulator [Chloroflexi bacterium]|nr:TetR/AcrR family transcriptional regulator [Chloroflexota bacterium]